MKTERTNRLINEKSPYLLQHARNPVDWYPWCEEAFERARREDKPVFLSIGYSACHWCHVMERESFEDESVARLLNEGFVSIKVDREERPDIDNIYMRVCQAFTGGGGWPTSVFMTAAQKPFYAGTYFPKKGFTELLRAVKGSWKNDRAALLKAGSDVAAMLGKVNPRAGAEDLAPPVSRAVESFRESFDERYGGFGTAPKFPSPHNLMLLLETAPDMAKRTLKCMYEGGIFDHIGGGFSRYSTDRFWLAPHFEKMLYDNALLALAYLLAYEKDGNGLWRRAAEATLSYMARELEAPEGGFYSSQDADSGGEEGGYYVFTPKELEKLLGREDGGRFCESFGITEKGNFDGKSIPNLIGREKPDERVMSLIPKVYEYRKERAVLPTDNKILLSWNALALAAFADAHRILGGEKHLKTALKTMEFIEENLTDGDGLVSSITDGTQGAPAFLDDYAYYIFALYRLHQATGDERLLTRALALTNRVTEDFLDGENGGFFFSGTKNERLLFEIKESYDGALPSGNSVMAYNLSRLAILTGSEELYALSEKQNAFMNGEAAGYPAGYGFYLYSTLPVKEVVCVPAAGDAPALQVRSEWVFRIAREGERELKNGKTTYYVCEEGACRPASNEPPKFTSGLDSGELTV